METTSKRYSKQRECILRILSGTTSHPTANWIYDHVREEIPNISLGTVYRNLSNLSQDGAIMRLDVGDGTDRFDANFHPHYHFYCQECRNLLDMELPYDSALDSLAEHAYGAKIAWHNLIFYGCCADCQSTEKE
ncbi:MAG: transcriptional repressor [Clostridia bacterium]|nr:transcriptional repressor [Clostridia bacterium]